MNQPTGPAAATTPSVTVEGRAAARRRPRGTLVKLAAARWEQWREPGAQWLLLPACVPALVMLYRLALVLLSRWAYPFDIEWMEGGELLHAHRLLHGLPLYPDPGGFMPYPYAPGHALVLALFGALFGLDYALGRCVSIASILLAGGLLGREVYRSFEGSRWPGVWALLAAGAMAAGFPVCGDWYDIIRVDSFAMGVLVAAVVTTHWASPPTRARLAATAVLLVAAVFAKQTNGFFVPWLVLCASIRSPRAGLAVGLASAALLAGATAAAQRLTHGNFLHYTVETLRAHAIYPEALERGGLRLLRFAPYLVALPPLCVVLAWQRALSQRALLWNGVLLVGVPACLASYAKHGGYDNTFLPIAMLAGPTALLTLGDLLRTVRSPRLPGALSLVFATVAAGYLHSQLFETAPRLATPARYRAVGALNAYVAKLEGGVLIPYAPFLATRNGQATEQFHAMSWCDALAARQEVDHSAYVERVRPRYVLFTGVEDEVIRRPFATEYVVKQHLPLDTGSIRTFAGAGLGLEWLLERTQPARAQRCIADFEGGSYAGWTVSGDAFGEGPKPFDPPGQGLALGVQGRALANSYTRRQGDRAVGTLVSPPFGVAGPRLSLRVGGGDGPRTRVELRVDGAVLHSATGHRSEMLHEVEWNLEQEQGGWAQLAIIDEDAGGWGHILVDAVCWR